MMDAWENFEQGFLLPLSHYYNQDDYDEFVLPLREEVESLRAKFIKLTQNDEQTTNQNA